MDCAGGGGEWNSVSGCGRKSDAASYVESGSVSAANRTADALLQSRAITFVVVGNAHDFRRFGPDVGRTAQAAGGNSRAGEEQARPTRKWRHFVRFEHRNRRFAGCLGCSFRTHVGPRKNVAAGWSRPRRTECASNPAEHIVRRRRKVDRDWPVAAAEGVSNCF